MTQQKIIVYFTPDITATGRIPISDIRFDETKGDDKKRGRFEISIKHPDLLEGMCTSHKSAIKSTASLTFLSKCFGVRTKYVFKTSDYFEIWDTSDPDDPWCYFRGTVKQRSRSFQGDKRTYTLTLENAGGWLLGDNSIYYLRPLIIAKDQTPSKFFDPIKSRYGWLQNGKNTQAWENLQIERVKSPGSLMETLIEKIVNVRVDLLRKDFYDNQEAIKTLAYYTGSEVDKNTVFVADKLSEMEGSILQILQKFEGRPFSEIFLVESKFRSVIFWRNTRWRDYREELCMGQYAGSPENLITLYDDPKIKFSGGERSIDYSGSEGYKQEKQYSGMINDNGNTTTDDVANSVFLYPSSMGSRDVVPATVIHQTRYDQDGAKNILDLNSIIRHGYRPITIELPFIPPYMEQSQYSDADIANRVNVRNANYQSIGQYLSEFTAYAAAMFRNIQDAENGQSVFQNNLHVTIADDYRVVGAPDEDPSFINVNRITWYFDATAPRTTLEWDRKFENPVPRGYTDLGVSYA